MHDALLDLKWISGLSVDNFSVEHIGQFIMLWGQLLDVTLIPGLADSIVWTLTGSGTYSAKPAYKAQFLGSAPCSFKRIVWKTWAPSKCRFFAWLAVQYILWTSDRLAIKGWPHQPFCATCRTLPETVRHILFECRFSRRIWLATTYLT